MMVKGEGGEMKLDKGRAMWEKAAAKGCGKSQDNLDKLRGLLDTAAFLY